MLELSEQWLVASSTHNLATKQDAQQFLKDLDALQGRTLAVNMKLWGDEVNGNANFSDELRKLVAENPAISPLMIAGGNLQNGISLYFLTFDYLPPNLRDQLAQLLRPFQGAVFESATSLKKWIYQTNERIAERRKTL